jgi:hypothetical protein
MQQPNVGGELAALSFAGARGSKFIRRKASSEYKFFIHMHAALGEKKYVCTLQVSGLT